MQILADILMVVRTGARKTRIMYQANLSYRLLIQYLGYALEVNLLSRNESQYVVTPKGFEFLEKYNKYLQRSNQLEEQLEKVANEKATLEKNYILKLPNSGASESS